MALLESRPASLVVVKIHRCTLFNIVLTRTIKQIKYLKQAPAFAEKPGRLTVKQLVKQLMCIDRWILHTITGQMSHSFKDNDKVSGPSN